MKVKLIIIFLFFCFFSQAQEKDNLDIRIMDSTSIQNYSQEAAFNYINEPIIEDKESWKSKILRWLAKHAFDSKSYTIKPLLYIFMIITVVMLLYFFSKHKMISIFEKKKSKKLLELSALNENIIEIDFKHLIQQAEDTAQYRLAVRFQFNRLLQTLNDQKIIDWAVYKTNFDFLNEMKNPIQKDAFQNIATFYDYIWYGEQSLDETRYTAYKSQISDLTQKIS